MELYQWKETLKREDFRPLSFWAWNDKLEDKEILRQIKEFHDQEFAGFFMHSRGGLRTPYLSDEWFHACRTAVKAARQYDMKAWIYDEDGWPSGFAGGRVNGLGEEYMAKYFLFQEEMPENPNHTIISYRKVENRYCPCEFEEAELWAVYKIEPDYADLLSEKVTKVFINITHERYKKELGEYFGETIPGFFTDEPQFFRIGYPFSQELGKYFRDRNGYAMEPEIYKLLPQFADSASHSFRSDFWNTIQEMMENHFSKQIGEWCEKNGLIFTGHYPGEDSLIQQMVSTAGIMPKYRHMQMPGIDHLGRRITSLLLTKQVTSVAKQLGRKKVLSETFGCAGWNIPFEDMCYIWGWQAAVGVNIPALHIGAYTMAGIRKRDYPAFYSYQEPWWQEFHHISKWLSGIGYKMSQGRWLEDVLVISPMQSVFCSHGTDTVISDLEKDISASYRQLCDCLMETQIGFDLSDETILEEGAQIENGALIVGKCSYRMVIAPKCIRLTEAVWDMLECFYKNGGIVIFADQVPISEKVRSWTEFCPVVCNVKRFWLKYFQASHYKRTIEVYGESGFYLAEGLHIAVKEDNGTIRAYIWNRMQDSEREVLLRIEGSRSIFMVNPETLKRRPLYGAWVDREGYTVQPIHISKKESLLLELEFGAVFSERKELTELTQKIPGCFARAEDNLLAIDFSAFSLDGGIYSDSLPIVKLQPAIYHELAQKSAKVLTVKYEFDNQMVDSKELKVIVEKRECVDILCNGTTILGNNKGWYMDCEFSVFSIDGLLVTGTNTIEICYHIKQDTVKDTEGLFETEVNRFFYPIEPEAVYIMGNFSVRTKNKVCRQLTHIRVCADGGPPHFYLADAFDPPGDMIGQGLWFYRGNLQMVLKITKERSQKIFLRFRRPDCSFVEVRCSENSLISYMPPYKIDVSDYLNEGENEVLLILHGTNRNLLGPHHHCKGENLFVGCNTFKGQRGYEDTIFNFELENEDTWTDDYSFAPFGCEGIEIIIEEA